MNLYCLYEDFIRIAEGIKLLNSLKISSHKRTYPPVLGILLLVDLRTQPRELAQFHIWYTTEDCKLKSYLQTA